ncbi:MAG: hypothetical protein QOC71_1994, partial [Thermoplasmata archaeon]|nr:hypothetical protein [Thermoplasmata archaeon]
MLTMPRPPSAVTPNGLLVCPFNILPPRDGAATR